MAREKKSNRTFIYSLQAQHSRVQTPRHVDSVWMKPDALGSRKEASDSEIEMQAREAGSHSS